MAGLSLFVEGRVRDQMWIPEDHEKYSPCTGYKLYTPGDYKTSDSRKVDLPAEEKLIRRPDSIECSHHKRATESREKESLAWYKNYPGSSGEQLSKKAFTSVFDDDSHSVMRNVTITTRYCEPTELEMVAKIRGDQELSRQLVYSNNELLHDQKASIVALGKKVDDLHSSITRGTPSNPSLLEAIGNLHAEMTTTHAAVEQSSIGMTTTRAAVPQSSTGMTATRAAVPQSSDVHLLKAIGDFKGEIAATRFAVQQLHGRMANMERQLNKSDGRMVNIEKQPNKSGGSMDNIEKQLDKSNGRLANIEKQLDKLTGNGGGWFW